MSWERMAMGVANGDGRSCSTPRNDKSLPGEDKSIQF